MIFSPLEQFSVLLIFPLFVGSFDFSFTNSSLFFFLAVGLTAHLFSITTENGGRLSPTH
jgi:hypothetical protein